MIEQSAILREAENFVSDLLKEQRSENLVFHNFQHTLDTVTRSKKVSNAYAEMSKEDLEALLIATWFHDTGYTSLYEGHEEQSKEIATAFLQKTISLSGNK